MIATVHMEPAIAPPLRSPRQPDPRVASLRAALLDGRLRLVAQPIVDVHSGATVTEELLLRLVRPNGGLYWRLLVMEFGADNVAWHPCRHE